MIYRQGFATGFAGGPWVELTFDGENKLNVDVGVATAAARVLMLLNRDGALADFGARGKRLFCNWVHLEDLATSRNISHACNGPEVSLLGACRLTWYGNGQLASEEMLQLGNLQSRTTTC